MPSQFDSLFATRIDPLMTRLGQSGTWYHGELSEDIDIILDQRFAPVTDGEVEIWGRQVMGITVSAVRARDQIKLGDVVYTVSDVIDLGGVYELVLER